MKNIFRNIFVLVILISGLAFTPYFMLPNKPFHWKNYAFVYVPEYPNNIFLPLILKQVKLVPGLYIVDKCDSFILFSPDYGRVGEITECVPSVEIRDDMTMQFNFTWSVNLYLSGSITKHSDENNRNMYLIDRQGVRYDHFEVGGDAGREVTLFDGDSAEGWFLFPPPQNYANLFTFYDDDNGVQIKDIILGK